MSQAGEGSRKPESAKRAGLGREAVVAAAHRSPRRSSLFWWLFDHYDELIDAKGLSALGFELCGKLGCAPKACIISGGRFHPESCRLIW